MLTLRAVCLVRAIVDEFDGCCWWVLKLLVVGVDGVEMMLLSG